MCFNFIITTSYHLALAWVSWYFVVHQSYYYFVTHPNNLSLSFFLIVSDKDKTKTMLSSKQSHEHWLYVVTLMFKHCTDYGCWIICFEVASLTHTCRQPAWNRLVRRIFGANFSSAKGGGPLVSLLKIQTLKPRFALLRHATIANHRLSLVARSHVLNTILVNQTGRNIVPW